MPFRDTHSTLGDILESIQTTQRFVEGLDLDALVADERTQAAVERKLQVLSEAAIRLRDDAEALCPGVPWRDIRGIGNWLRHQYDRVDLETIWNTIQDDLPALKAAVEKALE
jgi:uncharacterized protein with HEPN domain